MNLRKSAAAIIVACVVCLGCKHRWSDGPRTPPRLERQAQRSAKDSARLELDCIDLYTKTISAGDTGEARWFTVEVEGCGRAVVYNVTCARGICTSAK